MDTETTEGTIVEKTLNFLPYEVNGVIFPGMGAQYLDESGLGGYPAIIFPEGRVSIQLNNMLTSYAIDHYISDQKCFHYDWDTLSKALVKTKDYFFNLVALGFVIEVDNHWSIV